MRNKRQSNYNIYSGFSFFTPGIGGSAGLLGMFILGTILAALLSSVFLLISKAEIGMEFLQFIMYPLSFIPAMIFASLQSKNNSFFSKGYKLDSNNFGHLGAFKAVLLAIVLALAGNFVLDILGYVLPEMPEYLKEAMESLTGGNFFLDFICVSIFAPFFEEWLCRGEILRGLLNYKRADGSRGIKPVWAILLSAAIFAVIHGNIWQGLVAFLIGCLMGYVYYKTGSLKLTMIMHFVNNTMALVFAQLDVFSDSEYFIDVMGAKWYWMAFAACAIMIFLAIRCFSKIQCKDSQGNCDMVDPSEI